MASFAPVGASTTAQTLVEVERGFIGSLGSLNVQGTAVTARGDYNQITVLGHLFGSDTALHFRGYALSLVVGEDGWVGGDSTLDLRAEREINLVNQGTIYSDYNPILIRSGGTASLYNEGAIIGGGGISIRSQVTLTNFGVISSESGAFTASRSNDELYNYGTIHAASLGVVYTGGGSDLVDNSGAINGSVSLQHGHDTYVGRGKGAVEKLVDGGPGQDMLTGGNADDWLYGGEGRDRIAGRRGNDSLAGGNGRDVFIFQPNGGFDRVRDYDDGDKIDLSRLGLTTFEADVRHRIEDVAGGSVIEFSHHRLTVFLEDVDASELGRSDFILAGGVDFIP